MIEKIDEFGGESILSGEWFQDETGAWCPPSGEMAAMLAEIREGWSEKEHQSRIVGPSVVSWEVPSADCDDPV